MTGGVVDELELVQIQIQQGMRVLGLDVPSTRWKRRSNSPRFMSPVRASWVA
jgi:hypothetical protein